MSFRSSLKSYFSCRKFNYKSFIHVYFAITSENNKVVNQNLENRDFPGGAVVKNPPANAGDTGSSPGLGRSPMVQSN